MSVPMSLPAEKEALYKMIANSDKVLARTLVPEDFHDPVHRDIFVAEAKLVIEYGTGDFVSIAEAMKDNVGVQKAGGSAYLAQLCILDVPESPTAGIIRILKARRIERDMVQAASEMHTKEAKEVPAHLMVLSKEMGQLLPTEDDDQRIRIIKAANEGTNTISTGYKHMDEVFGGGFKDGALYTFASRPGGGKSTLLANFGAHLIDKERDFLFISLEMTENEVMEKLLQATYDIYQKAAQDEMEDLLSPIKSPFTINDTSFTLDKVTTEILCSDAPIIFIDYIQLIRDPSASTKLAEVTNITRTLKLLAMEIKKPIVTACQMSRAIEQDNAKKKPHLRREPYLSDLRESGSIEQDSNVVCFLWNDASQESEEEKAVQSTVDDMQGYEPSKLEIIVRKNRSGPETYTGKHIELTFDMPKSRIYETI